MPNTQNARPLLTSVLSPKFLRNQQKKLYFFYESGVCTETLERTVFVARFKETNFQSLVSYQTKLRILFA